VEVNFSDIAVRDSVWASPAGIGAGGGTAVRYAWPWKSESARERAAAQRLRTRPGSKVGQLTSYFAKTSQN
jgi:hypothetical protein